MSQVTGKVIGLVVGFLSSTVLIASILLLPSQSVLGLFLPFGSAVVIQLIGLVVSMRRESRTRPDAGIMYGFKTWTLIGSLAGTVSFYMALTLKNPLIIPPVMLVLFFLAFFSKTSVKPSKKT